ncbi:response regulator [Anaeromyxobacter oryzae]|uniref:Response regulatory domain-containing protein n=1 Tax=Anaeromyxobacter oryzae TaxID=2918170 RepID=A0ABM7WV50_9BACT|nr:response regulator [Anaeromyxobacter oryzae]BDG03336.1 hypothetical protein AMOR_23320 [Anaeromyxobacter oryzae]
MASTVEYTNVFVRVDEERLAAVERLVLAFPLLLDGALHRCDLAFRPETRFLAVGVHLRATALSPQARDRLSFWTARAGGRATPVARLSGPDLAQLRAHLAACEVVRLGVLPPALAHAAASFFTEAGAPRERRRAAVEPVLAMDVGGPGWEGVRYDPEEGLLFVAAPIAPPSGDDVALAFRIPGAPQPIEARGRVVQVVTPTTAGPGHAAGYGLRLEAPPAALVSALEARPAASPGAEIRAAPRFPVSAPVKVIARSPLATRAHAKIEYATDQELARDFVENLSQGGAFVRTSHPPPVGSPVSLELRLPNGAELCASAQVAFVNGGGMGVRFQLAPDAEAVLAAAIAHISARPRRALLVDDDALVRRMLADALAARGFEVLTAADAQDGLRTLSAELLALDLLVTDVRMPGMDGEALVRMIRTAGGETELAIVVVTGSLDPGTESRLEAAGADAVLDKALGPELVAQAADAVLERKRMVAAAG